MPFPFDQPFPFRDNQERRLTVVIEPHSDCIDWDDIPYTITDDETQDTEQ